MASFAALGVPLQLDACRGREESRHREAVSTEEDRRIRGTFRGYQELAHN